MRQRGTIMGDKIGYARVSTVDQNLQLQEKALKESGCTRIFTDKATGTREERPNFKRCLEYLRKEDTLVVWKLDRLGRNAKHLISLMEELEKREIHFQSLTESFDTKTPMGKAVFTFMCAIAQMERDVIAERTKAGILVAKAKGHRPGPKYSLNDAAIEQIKILMVDPKIRVKDIADQYGVFRSTLYRSIKRYDEKMLRKQIQER